MKKINENFNVFFSKNREKIIPFISVCLIVFSVYIIYLQYRTNRSLWVDEAMLAFSFTQRSFFDLTNTIFEWDQSAPILYLYIVKIITSIIGYSEFSLRIFSFISYILMLFVSYKIFLNVFKIKYPILGVAFIANMRILIYYANEFKPYMNDTLSVLLVIYLYYLYSQEKINFVFLTLIYAIFPWLSYPTIFFIGGVMIYEFIESIVKKQKDRSVKIVVAGLVILASFIINYFIWLKPVANDEYMVNFWANHRFPLFPTSFSDLKRIITLSAGLIAGMKYNGILVGMMVLLGFIISLIKNSKYHLVNYISIFLVLVASYIGKYPFYSRLMLFIYPILAIYIFIALDELFIDEKSMSKKIFSIGLVVALMISNYGSIEYLNIDNRYIDRNETNLLIDYLEENIKSDEMLYVYYRAIPGYTFRKGHNNLNIGKNISPNKENVVLGEGSFPDDRKGIDSVDFEKIKEFDKVYILVSHHRQEIIDEYLNELLDYGNIELIKEEYSTPLYFYSSEKEDMKGKAFLELLDYSQDGNSGIATIKIKNTGEAILNASNLDDLYLSSTKGDIINYKLEDKDIKPNDEIILEIKFEWEEGIDSFEVQLLNKDKYWFDELGVKPIEIKRQSTETS